MSKATVKTIAQRSRDFGSAQRRAWLVQSHKDVAEAEAANAWDAGYRSALADLRKERKRAGGSAHQPTLHAVVDAFLKPSP